MGDIAQIVGGGTPDTNVSAYWGEGTSWITPADLSGYSSKCIARGARSITSAGLQNSGARVMPAGTVLMSSRAPVGYVAIAAEPLSTNQGFKSFVLHDNVIPDYAYWYLRGNRELLLEYASGTTFAEISGRQAGEIPIPVPPIGEQRRIVAALEEYHSALDDAVAGLLRARVRLSSYLTACFEAAAVGTLLAHQPTGPSLEWLPLSNILDNISQGWSPKCHPEPPTDAEQWAVIKTTSIQHARFDSAECKALPSAFKPRPELEIRVGDLLVTRKGPRARAGVAAAVRSTRERVMVCDTVYRIRLNRNIARPHFMAIVMASPTVAAAIDAAKAGISESGVSLTHERLGAVRVPLPPLEVQAEVESELDRRMEAVDRLRADLDFQLARANRLGQSILQRAFSGGLVPQDPADERAAELFAAASVNTTRQTSTALSPRGRKRTTTTRQAHG